MNRTTGVPADYRRFYFVNAGGPLRKVVRREFVGRHWQLLTLGCGDSALQPRTLQAGRARCGFCGGLQPLPPEGTAA
jgi:hypothetical protein